MESIEIMCPHCGARFKGDESHIGLTGECDQCGKNVEISISAPAQAPQPSPLEGVGRKLEAMVADWQGPSPLPVQEQD